MRGEVLFRTSVWRGLSRVGFFFSLVYLRVRYSVCIGGIVGI